MFANFRFDCAQFQRYAALSSQSQLTRLPGVFKSYFKPCKVDKSTYLHITVETVIVVFIYNIYDFKQSTEQRLHRFIRQA